MDKTEILKNIGFLLICLLISVFVNAQERQTDSTIPQGKLHKYTMESRIFNGTVRDYWIYEPAFYDSSQAANLMVFQDGEYMIWGD